MEQGRIARAINLRYSLSKCEAGARQSRGHKTMSVIESRGGWFKFSSVTANMHITQPGGVCKRVNAEPVPTAKYKNPQPPVKPSGAADVSRYIYIYTYINVYIHMYLSLCVCARACPLPS